MTVAIWIVLATFGVALFIVCGALVEMYRSLEQVRQYSGASDAPTKVDVELDADVLERAGLASILAPAERSLLLVLSDRCSTCEMIADNLGGTIPQHVWLLLRPVSADSGRNWLARHALETSPSVIFDGDGHISDNIGINITPTALRITNGHVTTAHTVPSSRRLLDELEWLVNGGTNEPEYQPRHPTYYSLMRQLRNESANDNEVKKGTAG